MRLVMLFRLISSFAYIIMQIQRTNQQQRKAERIKQDYQKAYMEGKENNLGLYKKLMSDYGEGEPLLTLGPNYVFFLTALAIVNFTSFIIIFKLSSQERFKPFYFISIVILIYLDVVWLATALINPGIAPYASLRDADLCDDCMSQGREVTKSEGREHCEECRVCIDDQVMHFKLVGACIGKNNFIAFKLLLLGLFLWTLSVIMIIPQTVHMI